MSMKILDDVNAFIVADVGNSRIKWGLCNEREVLRAAGLPLEDSTAWERQLFAWKDDNTEFPLARGWMIAGVNPEAIQRLSRWLAARGFEPIPILANKLLPLRTQIEFPEEVGVDRLLNAVAFNSRHTAGQPGIIVDAGSAVTVDWVDRAGIFRGGAILPGQRLMAQALHECTAKLPLVAWNEPPGPMPGMNTHAAIAGGIHGAVVGGILRLAEEITGACRQEPARVLTGGDAPLLAPALPSTWKPWPHMTLEGLRLTALRLS